VCACRGDPLISLNYGVFLYNQDRVAAAADQYRQYMANVKALGPASLDPVVRLTCMYMHVLRHGQWLCW